MKILIACEYSGRVRDAFAKLGQDVTSCDILPSEGDPNGKHYQGDVRDILNNGWDMMIGFPECTYLCGSGIHWNKRRPERATKTEKAVEFFRLLYDAPIPLIALENPVGIISSRIRKPDQIIQPFQFGEDASKSTCLWLKGLPKLVGTDWVNPRVVNFPDKPSVRRWSNQTDSGQNKLGPSETRAKTRSLTYQGIADAMAAQWGSL